MTNNTSPYISPALRRDRRNESGHYANALAFVIESFLEGNAEDYTDFSTMDYESLHEFAEQYGTTTDMIAKAVRDIRTVAEMTMVD